jgi:hypothetical protein
MGAQRMKRRWVFAVAAAFILLSTAQAEAKIKYAGGNGSSPAQAIRIVGARGEADGVHSEYVWLKKYRPGCSFVAQSLISAGGREIDHMDINCQGKRQSVYFDITGYFGKI